MSGAMTQDIDQIRGALDALNMITNHDAPMPFNDKEWLEILNARDDLQAAHARYAQKELAGDFQTTRLIAAHALIKDGRADDALPMLERAIKCAREQTGEIEAPMEGYAGGEDAPKSKHPSHETRGSDSSLYDEVCVKCGATDHVPGGWGKLAEPCPAVRPAPAVPDDVYKVLKETSLGSIDGTVMMHMNDYNKIIGWVNSLLPTSSEGQ